MIPPEDGKYVLVLNGAAASCIVVPKEATKGELDAAEELQRYVEKITGARLPILTSLDDSATFSILIGRASARSGLTFPDLDRESYIIRTNGKALFIHGADDDGVFFAVCTFLERYCDVRWFWPGELGEVVPQRSTLVIPGIDVQETPAFCGEIVVQVARCGAAWIESPKCGNWGSPRSTSKRCNCGRGETSSEG